MRDLHIGKFFVPFNAIDNRDISKALKEMEFVPLRVECLGHRRDYKYVGTSPLFEQITPGEVIPEYTIMVNNLDSNKIKVTAIKIEVKMNNKTIKKTAGQIIETGTIEKTAEQIIETVGSLNNAMIIAGGEDSLDVPLMKSMSLFYFICYVAAPNGIRFTRVAPRVASKDV